MFNSTLFNLGLTLAFFFGAALTASGDSATPVKRFTVAHSLTRLSHSDRPTSWDYCPLTHFVTSVYVQRQPLYGNLVSGLAFGCSDPSDTRLLMSEVTGGGAWREEAGCFGAGRVVGFQLSLQEGGRGALASLALFCFDHGTGALIRRASAGTGVPREPLLCPQGEYVCGVSISAGAPLQDLAMRCCMGPRNSSRVAGKIIGTDLFSANELAVQSESHFNSVVFDAPYWFKWRFCPPGTYAVSIQLGQNKRTLRLWCAAPADIQYKFAVDDDGILGTESEEYADQSQCQGFAVGFQAEFNRTEGISNVRLFCSSGQPYVNHAGGFNGVSGEFVQEPRFCSANQAICGMKLIRSGFLDQRRCLLELKFRCCPVPEVAEICVPSDEYELIVECDATNSVSPATCMYTNRVGMSRSQELSAKQRREMDVREGLSYERSLVSSESMTDGTSESSGLVDTARVGQNGGATWTESTSNSSSSSDQNSRGGTRSSGLKITGSNSRSDSASSLQGERRGSSTLKGHDRSEGFVNTDSSAFRAGTLRTVSVGTADREQKTLSRSWQDTTSDGSSRARNSESMSGRSSSNAANGRDFESSSDTSSTTDSESSSSSSTHGWKVQTSVEASAGVDVGFATAKVSTSFSTGAHGSYSSGSSSASSSTNEQDSSRGSDRGRSTTRTESSQDSRTRSDAEGQTVTRSRVGEGFTTDTRARTGSRFSQLSTGSGRGSSTQRDNQDRQSDSDSAGSQVTVDHSRGRMAGSGSEWDSTRTYTETDEYGEGSGRDLGLDATRSVNRARNRDGSVQRENGTNRELSVGTETGQMETDSEDENTRLTTGYDWGRSSTETFNEETSVTVSLTVPPGFKSRLYQVVGRCSVYSVRASVFRREDVSAEWEVHLARLEEAERVHRAWAEPNIDLQAENEDEADQAGVGQQE